MKHNREYEIAWQGLKPGIHLFMYDIDDPFMQARDGETGFKDWETRVTLKFDKHEGFFMLHFDIDGQVTVPCDRCGDDFRLRLWDEFDLVIKLMGEDAAELEDEVDVAFIPRSETVIDVSDWLYEFVMLSVPLQHIHPNGPNGETGCNPEALKLLNQLSGHEDEQLNPLWKGLENLKTNKKIPTKPRK